MTINELVAQAHKTAVEHGFWGEAVPFGQAIALIYSELSEAQDVKDYALRAQQEQERPGGNPDEKGGKSLGTKGSPLGENSPLTLAELRQMVGEPVWAVSAPSSHTARADGWISVKDELPEPDEIVLIIAYGNPCENITLFGAYQLAAWCPEGWILEMWPEWMDARVTHWMPLPEPPEESDHASL